MKIAIISDIHSNNYALEAVLKDINSQDVDTIVCTGDIVGYMPNPNETIELMRQHKILSIQGNHDLRTISIEPLSKEAFEALDLETIQQSASAIYTSYILKDQNREFMTNLPQRLELTINGYKLLFVHGSPRAINEYMYEDAPYLQDILENEDANVIIAGHTHIPYFKEIDHQYIINAGSVGKPKHGNSNATYVILSVVKGKLDAKIREVAYDYKPMIKDILENPYVPDKLISSIEVKN